MAQDDLRRLGVTEALADLTDAMPALFGVDGAGVLLIDDSQVLRHVAATDAIADLLEALQEADGKGPCVQALVDNRPVMVDDFTTDSRWPGLAQAMVANGACAVLGAPVRVGGVPVGSINVYKRDAYRWDDSDTAALEAFDRIAEHILTSAVTSDRNEALVAQLQHALESRIAIERAVGYLMASESLDAASAFERLRRAARSSRRTVREVAAEITA